MDDVLSFAGGPDAAVEVGAGTGKASRLFADRGIRLTCLEPDPAMAAVGRANLAQAPVEFVVTSFEDWTAPVEPAPLLYAAQSWHWVSPEVRCAKAHRVLSPGGTLAPFWNAGETADEALRAAIAATYRAHLPDSPKLWDGGNLTGAHTRNDWAAAEMEASGLFGTVETVRHGWETTYSTEEWLGLLVTQSDHRLLEDEERRQLLDAVGEVIDVHGGQIATSYVATAYLARARA